AALCGEFVEIESDRRGGLLIDEDFQTQRRFDVRQITDDKTPEAGQKAGKENGHAPEDPLIQPLRQPQVLVHLLRPVVFAVRYGRSIGSHSPDFSSTPPL